MNLLEETVMLCKCGNANLIIWLEDLSLFYEDSIMNLEKIECPDCESVVYGGGEEEIKQWNAQIYDD